MNWILLTTTFLVANLDFFIILLLLLQKISLPKVIVGYVIGLLLILSACALIGSTLSRFLPEWLMGTLGIIPIWMAFHDDDDDDDAPESVSSSAGILTVTITYLSVCAACNLAIFLPVISQRSMSFTTFALLLAYIVILSTIITMLINWVGRLSVVKNFLQKYGEIITKICYVAIGIYVFFDSGLISHLWSFVA